MDTVVAEIEAEEQFADRQVRGSFARQLLRCPLCPHRCLNSAITGWSTIILGAFDNITKRYWVLPPQLPQGPQPRSS